MHIDPNHDSLSYWHATQESMIPTDDLPATAEVVVIGGGMLGVWTTYWLAKAGVSVVLLEKSAIGWGATGRNGGFLTSGTAIGYPSLIELLGRERARALWEITVHGENLGHEVVSEEGIDCHLRRPGKLLLALDEDQLADRQHHCDLLNEDGFGGIVLDRAATQEMIKTPLGADITGAFFHPTSGMLHSTRYLAGLARTAVAYGAKLVRAEVTSVHHGKQTTISTTAGAIEAERVIIALNAWTDTLVPETRDVIVPTRGQILAYEPTETVFTTGLGAEVTPTGEYWQQTMDGSIVIGGCRAEAPGKDSGVINMSPTDDVISHIERVIPRLFPKLAHLTVARRWAGPMAFTPDYLPIVDMAQNAESTWYAGGFCGDGMPFGPIISRYLAEAATTGKLSDDVSMLAVSRPSLAR
ncbi:MAG: FAD-binding oxidoreductase [Thermomicrobiales bacterium]|nr:FAD-binding oxidoreductase [Thermomicrobiales bacterium]MCO5219731.1 FAD-binding oxidoreductase [Thermomicrobiales bacterium]MCO5226148.1 FAD-binding oxidoreductase [Thermomicrobiales bacterium]MCO5227278.1 FAD-binding oxidoreductase [Thermomicrobiales bacterium]